MTNSQNKIITKKKARDILEDAENNIKNCMIEAGWVAIEVAVREV